MMAAAARAELTRRPHFTGGIPQPARAFLDNLRRGPSKRGSYVLAILSRVPPKLWPEQDLLFDGPDAPFERKAVARLNTALVALRAAADRAGTNLPAEEFRRTVADGVSSDLCSALVNMNGPVRNPRDELCVGFTWARGRPAPAKAVREVTFAADAMPMIAEAARLFRATRPVDDTDIQGTVVQLRRDNGAIPPAFTAVILTDLDGRPRRVRVDLDESTHQAAVDAYTRGVSVACRGDLVGSAGAFTLLNVREFGLIGG